MQEEETLSCAFFQKTTSAPCDQTMSQSKQMEYPDLKLLIEASVIKAGTHVVSLDHGVSLLAARFHKPNDLSESRCVVIVVDSTRSPRYSHPKALPRGFDSGIAPLVLYFLLCEQRVLLFGDWCSVSINQFEMMPFISGQDLCRFIAGKRCYSWKWWRTVQTYVMVQSLHRRCYCQEEGRVLQGTFSLFS